MRAVVPHRRARVRASGSQAFGDASLFLPVPDPQRRAEFVRQLCEAKEKAFAGDNRVLGVAPAVDTGSVKAEPAGQALANAKVQQYAQLYDVAALQELRRSSRSEEPLNGFDFTSKVASYVALANTGTALHSSVTARGEVVHLETHDGQFVKLSPSIGLIVVADSCSNGQYVHFDGERLGAAAKALAGTNPLPPFQPPGGAAARLPAAAAAGFPFSFTTKHASCGAACANHGASASGAAQEGHHRRPNSSQSGSELACQLPGTNGASPSPDPPLDAPSDAHPHPRE